jgi:biotin carboxylase
VTETSRKPFGATIMVVGAGPLQLPAIKRAKEMGLRIISIDMDENAVGRPFSDVFEQVSTIDVSGALRVAKKHKPDGVLTLCTDAPLRVVAAVNDELGLKGIDSRTAELVTNKYSMRKKMRETGIPCPAFREVTSVSEAESAAVEIHYPVVIKPVDSSGSRGVFLTRDAAELRDFFSSSAHHSRTGKVIVEEFMSGAEVSVESLTADGTTWTVAVTDKRVTPPPYFVETGHTQPSSHDGKIIDDIILLTRNVVSMSGLDWSASHSEIKITPSGVRLVEMGARLGGDFITTHLVPLSTGVDMVEAIIKMSLGVLPDHDRKFARGSAVRYFTPLPGVIKDIKVPEHVRTHPALRELSFYIGIGDTVRPTTNSLERSGHLIVHAGSAWEAAKVADELCSEIEFVMA